MTLFGNWVFADIVKLRWGHIGLGWALHPIIGILIGERKRFRNRHTATREDGHVKKEAEIGVMSQAQECQRPAEAEKGQEKILPWNLWREHGLANILILNIQHYERINVYCLRLSSLRHLLLAAPAQAWIKLDLKIISALGPSEKMG